MFPATELTNDAGPTEYVKTGPTAAIAREAHHLRVVAGPGVVSIVDESPGSLRLARAHCSLADVLAARGRMPADESRGVAIAASRALARIHAGGLVHGDVKPANLLLADGGLWFADFDAAGRPGERRRRHSPGRHHRPTLSAADDVRSLVLTVIECATGVVVDPDVAWAALDLAALGCRPDLAAELALALRRADDAEHVAALFDPRDVRLPSPTAPMGADATPTIDVSLDDWW